MLRCRDRPWLKIIVNPIDSTRMRRSLGSGSRTGFHASRARAGRSRQRQSKWSDSTRQVHQNGAGNSAVFNFNWATRVEFRTSYS